MIDVTIIGSGSLAAACATVLTRAGFHLRRAFEADGADKSPVILGEVTGAFNVARQVVESGRHLLVANPGALTPERLATLLEARQRSQSLFVWSERRHHPAYHFVKSLTEADASWRPRFLRQQTLTMEPTNGPFARWLTLESLALVMSIAGDDARNLIATSVKNATRNSPELISVLLNFPTLEADLQIGLGEAIERRETLIATADRKAFVDELSAAAPLRIVEDERGGRGAPTPRFISCPDPSPDEMARQQCLSFLDATLKTQLATDEAQLWIRSMSALTAAEESLLSHSTVHLTTPQVNPRFRLVGGLRANRPTVA